MLDVVIPVHNGAHLIERTLQVLLAQAGLDEGARIFVVDDGSTDDIAAAMADVADERIRLVRLRQRVGRAAARNAGAEAGQAHAILFMDVDCRPADTAMIDRYQQCLADGADIAFGPVLTDDDGFWGQYATLVADDRAARAEAGDFMVMTSANLLVRRERFERCGGFHPGYVHYGFEDRDLVARLLAEQPVVAFEPGCAVVHDAGNTVENYCAKMYEAARWTAPIFSARFPGIYARQAYARLDPAQASAWRRPFMILAGRLFRAGSVWMAGQLVERPLMPWKAQAFALRAAAALSYLAGCLDRRPH